MLRDIRAAVIIISTESIPGKNITQVLGLVSGSTVRAKHIGHDIMASLKNIVGGELKDYTSLLEEARKEATARMIAEAEAMHADAVIGVRFSTSAITQCASEIFVCGTAVVLG